LNYDLWLGPAPLKPYNAKHVHYNFRFFWDYSGGQMTNFGAHHLDITQWALGMDNSGPISTEGTAEFHPQKWFEVSASCRVTHTYANGVKVIVGQLQNDIPGGCTFIGEQGKLFVTRGKLTCDPADILVRSTEANLYHSANHHQNFLDCIQSRELPICDVEIGHRSATVCHLGNLALRLGRKIHWDPATETITNDAEAQSMTSKAYREPWAL